MVSPDHLGILTARMVDKVEKNTLKASDPQIERHRGKEMGWQAPSTDTPSDDHHGHPSHLGTGKTEVTRCQG